MEKMVVFGQILVTEMMFNGFIGERLSYPLRGIETSDLTPWPPSLAGKGENSGGGSPLPAPGKGRGKG